MALPKRKHSKARRDKRRANYKLALPTLVPCPRCHQLRVPHHICLTCGYYNGKEIVEIKEV